MATKITEYLPKIDTKGWKSDQGMGSLTTFWLAAFLLLVAIGSGLFLVVNLIKDKEELQDTIFSFMILPSPVNAGDIIVAGVVFLVGMVIALVSVYLFNNQALPKLVWGYTWLCSIVGAGVYVKIAFNFSTNSFDFADRFVKYILACLIMALAVFVLPLIFERYRVQEFAFPIFIGNFFHLLFLLGHYIFGIGEIQNFFWGDLVLLLMMILLGVYFVQNAPLFAGIKRELDLIFTPKE